VSSARLLGPDGEVIADAGQLNLHLLNYSVPFHGTVELEELERHLHSLPDAPSLVPYRTSYYREAWGFCLSHAQRTRLRPGQYRVEIDTRLTEGSLTYGEAVVRGAEPGEILISTHCCHPSLANDNCAGMAMCALLAQQLGRMRPRYTYRFLFVPGTIGAIAWLARNEERVQRVAHGLVAACVGDSGGLTYKRSRRGNAEIDRAVVHVLANSGKDHQVRDFTPYGYDERYCCPGSIFPVVAHPGLPRISRVPHTRATTSRWSSRRRWPTPSSATSRYSRCWREPDAATPLPRGEPQLGARPVRGRAGRATPSPPVRPCLGANLADDAVALDISGGPGCLSRDCSAQHALSRRRPASRRVGPGEGA
jgi:hypothetical protein